MRFLNIQHRWLVTALLVVVLGLIFIFVPAANTHAQSGFELPDIDDDGIPDVRDGNIDEDNIRTPERTAEQLRTGGSKILNGLPGPGDLAIWAIQKPIEFLRWVLLHIASWMADILNSVFDIGSFTNLQFVQTGWALARDLANMFFIIILLVIAFATILRIESYGIKRLLPRLLIIALLINFSLLFAGIVIDIGNDIGFYFVTGGNGETQGDIGDALKDAISYQRLTASPDGALLTAGAAGDIGGDPKMAALARIFMQTLFLLVVAFIFAAMALIMIIRIPILWVLLIFLPLALVASIVPAGQKVWKQWVSKFIDWAFFPAIFGFFIYFAILAGQGVDNNAILPNADFAFGAGIIVFSLNNLVQYLVVITILFFGLIQSKKMGYAGAGYMYGVATKARDYALNKTKTGIRSSAGLATRPARRKAAEKLERAPLIGRAVGGPGAAQKRRIKAMKSAKSDLSDRSPDDLRSIMKMASVTEAGRARRAQAMKMLAEKGRLKEEDQQYFEDYLGAGGAAKDVLQRMPHWIKSEKIQSVLASSSATKKDWAPVARLEHGSGEWREATQRVFKDKFMAKKPKDFANVSNDALKDDDVRKWYREEFKKTILEIDKEGVLRERAGFLSASHLNAAINENPSAYYRMSGTLQNLETSDPEEYEALKKSVRDHLNYGASTITGMEGEAPGGGKAEGEGGGGGDKGEES